MCKKTAFIKIHLIMKIDIVIGNNYLNQVFHLLCSKRVTPVDALHYIPLI